MEKNESFSPIPVPLYFVYLLTPIHFAIYLVAGCLIHVVDPSVPFWIVLLPAYITSALAMLTHWSGHRRWSGWWYNAHMGHHITDYPPKK
jgi:hypothetical protein